MIKPILMVELRLYVLGTPLSSPSEKICILKKLLNVLFTFLQVAAKKVIKISSELPCGRYILFFQTDYSTSNVIIELL